MKVVTVTNRKGGVGKSTMAVHLAAGLAISGYRVGLIDTDSQGHAGLMLNMPEENGLYNILVGGRSIEACVYEVPADNYAPADNPPQGALFLLPSSDQTYKIPYELPSTEVFAVLEMVEVMAEVYQLDVLIIDTNPTMSLFDGHIYMATDGFIYVTECERLSFDGVEKATAQITNLAKSRRRYLGRASDIIGIIPNKLRANTILHRTNIASLAQVYGAVVWQPITLRTAWAEAANLNETVYRYMPTGQEARDAWYITEQVERVLQAWEKIV